MPLGSCVAPDAYAPAATDWRAGPLTYLAPCAGHDGLSLIAHITAPARKPPVLQIAGIGDFAAAPLSADGQCWRFSVIGLRPATLHLLRIDCGELGGTDIWPLATAPDPKDAPSTFRLLAFTCAGGDETTRPGSRRSFNPLTARRALLARALAFQPDAMVAIGDHVYWDQQTAFRGPRGAEVRANYEAFGAFKPDEPASGGANQAVLRKIGERQIAPLYGCSLRSTPSWFMPDDHDYFENDVFANGIGTFPPDAFRSELYTGLSDLFFPATPATPETVVLPGSSRSFMSLRWGRLFEGLLFDCRGWLSSEAAGWFVPTSVESWIARRTADVSIRHVVHIPSTPFGWSAGKWGEWYPDRAAGEASAKTGWRVGWNEQHDRLLGMLAQRRGGLILSGDLHAVGAARITRTNGADLGEGVLSVLCGPLGTDDLAFPSAARGTGPFRPSSLSLEPIAEPVEKNGFTVVDFTQKDLRVRQFAWRSPSSEADIAGLQPHIDHLVELA